jgi:hypothetical protein
MADPALAVPRWQTWFDKMPPDVQEELNQLKAAFRAGVVQGGKRRFAGVIVKHLTDQGLSTVGWNGVEAWLDRD